MLDQIEQELLRCDQAKFQKVCDLYLRLDRGYQNIERWGSVIGKNKTRKGIPDSYVVLEDGRFVFIEATTVDNKTPGKLFKKLESDLAGCMDEAGALGELSRIERIILCCNTRPAPKEKKRLIQVGADRGFKVEIIGVGTLASDISHKYKLIAKDILGLHLDTGQVLSIDQFVDEYEKAKSAVSLKYTLYGRHEKLKEFRDLLEKHDFLLVVGEPGVGKTRLTLEAIRSFTKGRSDYHVYCLSNKNALILSDLQVTLAEVRNYIILVDDAHRQTEHLKSILAFYRGFNGFKLKIVLTIRKYSRRSVSRLISDFDWEVVKLRKLNNDDIRFFLTQKPFDIKIPSVKDRIVKLADGNPRLAIMAAKVWGMEQNEETLQDNVLIYKKFFSSYLIDKEVFYERKILSALAIVSFFNIIDLNNKEFLEEISLLFAIDGNDFIRDIRRLADLEILDLLDDDSVRIGDQILATYVFYKVFLEEQWLSFEKLIFNYMHDYIGRLRDSIIPAIESLGRKRIMEVISPTLNEYWLTECKSYHDKYKYLEIFARYEPVKLFKTAYDCINNSPDDLIVAIPEGKSTGIDFSDSYLHFLIPYFKEPGTEFDKAINLTLEWLKKNTRKIEFVVTSFVDHLLFLEDDIQYRFGRQQKLFDLIEKKRSTHPVYNSLLLELFNSFTIGAAQGYLWGEKHDLDNDGRLNSVLDRITDYLWSVLSENLCLREIQCLEKINFHIDTRFLNTYTLNKESEHWTKIINDELDPGSFSHCVIVHNLLDLAEEIRFEFPDKSEWRKKYSNDAYTFYLSTGIDHWKSGECNLLTYEEYNACKRAKLVEQYPIKTYEGFLCVYNYVALIRAASVAGHIDFVLTSFDYLLQSAYREDADLGLEAFSFLSKESSLRMIPSLIYGDVLNGDPVAAKKLYQIIQNADRSNWANWLQRFFDFLPDEQIDAEYESAFVDLFSKTEEVSSYWIRSIEKFYKKNTSIYCTIFSVLLERSNSNADFYFRLPPEFFHTGMTYFQGDNILAGDIYLLQDKMDSGFDFKGIGFVELIKVFPEFLQKYLISKGDDNFSGTRSLRDFSGIWGVDNAEELIFGAMNLLLGESAGLAYSRLGDIFFGQLNEPFKQRAIKLLKKIIKSRAYDSYVINSLFYIIRVAMYSSYHELVAFYLSVNPDIDLFKKINLIRNQYTLHGNEVVAELQAIEWGKILSLLNSNNDSYGFSDHIFYVESMIHLYSKRALRERKMRRLEEPF